MSVSISPFLPAPNVTPREADHQVKPNSSVARAPDTLQDQRRASAQLVVSQQERKRAESLLANDLAAMHDMAGIRARKALQAYTDVAYSPERDYVSRVLGFDEFA